MLTPAPEEQAHGEQLPGEPRPDPEEKVTETVPTAHKPEGAPVRADVVSDPALDDHLGSDWQDEGGATSEGPATAPSQQEAGGDDDREDPEDPEGPEDPEDHADREAGQREEHRSRGTLPAITLDPPD